jgi:hypothetical protein
VVGIVAVVAVTAGGLWWILRSGPDEATSPAAASTRRPCEPTSGPDAAPGPVGAIATPDWDVTVAEVRAEPTAPAEGGGTFRAAPGEVFVVVTLRFRNHHPGQEGTIDSTAFALLCQDGTEREVAGLDDEGNGFCRICSMVLGTDARKVTWSLLFRMEQGSVAQDFRLAYGEVHTDPFSIAPGGS